MSSKWYIRDLCAVHNSFSYVSLFCVLHPAKRLFGFVVFFTCLKAYQLIAVLSKLTWECFAESSPSSPLLSLQPFLAAAALNQAALSFLTGLPPPPTHPSKYKILCLSLDQVWNCDVKISQFHLGCLLLTSSQKSLNFSLLLGSLCSFYISQPEPSSKLAFQLLKIFSLINEKALEMSQCRLFLQQSRPRWRPAGDSAATGVGIEAFSGTRSSQVLRRY